MTGDKVMKDSQWIATNVVKITLSSLMSGNGEVLTMDGKTKMMKPSGYHSIMQKRYQDHIDERTSRMNQPTRDEYEELKERVKKLEEQQTEPIKITRLEIDTGTMREEMKGVRADILSVKATQSDHSAFHIEHQQRLKEIEEKQNIHTELLGQLVNFAESHDKNMATKDDISRVEARIAEQGDLLKLILAELRKSRGE